MLLNLVTENQKTVEGGSCMTAFLSFPLDGNPVGILKNDSGQAGMTKVCVVRHHMNNGYSITVLCQMLQGIFLYFAAEFFIHAIPVRGEP
jgi:hypothetical protein